MNYEIKPLSCNPKELTGLSERLIVSHYDNNYGGAVNRLNNIVDNLNKLNVVDTPSFVLNGLKREELIAINSMILHELYFDSLGGTGLINEKLSVALTRDFGSVDHWSAEFTAMGKALSGGSGWVLLTYSQRNNRLMNQWASDHAHMLAGGTPILALDMYEHSYHMDYGTKAGAYVDAFMKNIDWSKVARRYACAANVAQ